MPPTRALAKLRTLRRNLGERSKEISGRTFGNRVRDIDWDEVQATEKLRKETVLVSNRHDTWRVLLTYTGTVLPTLVTSVLVWTCVAIYV